MPFSDSGRFVFIHIPKCAGMSVHSVLSGCVDDYAFVGPASLSQRISTGEIWLHHATAAKLRSMLPDHSWSSYFKFAVIRNPWDRLVSLYHYFLGSFPPYPRWRRLTPARDVFRHPIAAIGAVIDDIQHQRQRVLFARRRRQPAATFDQWVMEVLQSGHYRHCRPCADYVTNGNGKLILDRIVRFESLDAGFAEVAKTLGRPDLLLPVANASRRNAYRSYYTTASADRVGECFAEDIRLFDYRF